jgi:hypothetical protein
MRIKAAMATDDEPKPEIKLLSQLYYFVSRKIFVTFGATNRPK